MRIVLVGPFGFRVKMTMARRAMPIALELSERGHDVHVIVPPWDSPGDRGKNWIDSGVQVVQVLGRTVVPPLSVLCTGIHMVCAVLTVRPQVVHCFKPKAYSGLVHLALWLLRCVRMWRGAIIVDEDDWEGKGGWNERSDYSAFLRSLFAWQEQWGLRHADGVTVASHWLLEKVARTRNSERRVYYLPNCADALSSVMRNHDQQTGSTPAVPKKRDFPSVILVTRWVESTPFEVCDIWQRVLKEIPSSQLLIVGQGFDQEEEALRAEAERLRIAESISVRGWVSASTLESLLLTADVAIMPSDDSTISKAKFPSRVLDAMGAGLPIVASDVGEFSYIIEDGVSGLLVPRGDRQRFSQAVVRLLRDTALRAKLGKGAAAAARERYNCSLLAEGVEGLYADLTANTIGQSRL